MTETPTFGIDLGTTCSAIGLVENGHPRLIEIDGDVLVPSVIYFPEDGPPVVGRAAENQLLLAPARTLRSTKRRMGSAHCWQVGDRMVGASEAATAILEALVRGAEKATGIKPERVVVTVPAWFPHDARADTRRAAEAAGLEVVRLINEPTAAALAHGHGNPRDRVALVYDFGGGTFDASLVRQSGNLIEVLASNGDVELGGDDLDVRLVAHALSQLGADDAPLAESVRTSPAAQARIRAALRKAKHELSDALETVARQPFLSDVEGEARHLELKLDRATLERELMPLIERTFECVDTVLRDADMTADQVDELLLVGGTTHAPLIWDQMRSRYGWEGSSAIPAEHAVALGAAIQAAIVDGSFVEQTLLDVTPYGLSVATLTNPTPELECFTCEVITPRNAPLPSRHTKRFFTVTPRQKNLTIPVLQGTDPNPLRNVPLGSVSIDKLPPAPVGTPGRPIAVEFRQDLSGLVSIVVTDELSGRSVDGQVVVGGEESEQARQLLLDAIEDDGLLPGDGTDPDPYLEQEKQQGTAGWESKLGAEVIEDATFRSLAPSGSTPESDEAQQAFELVLARRDNLVRDHPEHGLRLLKIASDGMTALVENNVEVAIELYDDLSDELFDLGIYL